MQHSLPAFLQIQLLASFQIQAQYPEGRRQSVERIKQAVSVFCRVQKIIEKKDVLDSLPEILLGWDSNSGR